GVAKLQGRDAAATGAALLPAEPGALTGGGPLVGTIAYMSPEQLRGEAIDARSDLFSFGAVLYEMAPGRRLFAGSDATPIRAAILESEWQARRETADRVGEGLTRIIEKALRADRRDRYQHAADMRAELQQLDPAAGHQPGSRRWKLIAAAAALIVALTIAGALMAGVG